MKSYTELTSRYAGISAALGIYEGLVKGGSEPSIQEEIESLRVEKKELEEEIDSYNMKYNQKTWRCD